ncbi:hypothetical protein BLNAU_14778 [Blattamonas nauphoetae]|uniref:Uncharacterized protein n=1 Tax=Blattamonas nauphoetae TaxID=2049346 RepID=A0ABQ9XCQ5_9EUKA|nr:hypothetical protein BLNAU_14778 [Blattamonas nauphoetae]
MASWMSIKTKVAILVRRFYTVLFLGMGVQKERISWRSVSHHSPTRRAIVGDTFISLSRTASHYIEELFGDPVLVLRGCFANLHFPPNAPTTESSLFYLISLSITLDNCCFGTSNKSIRARLLSALAFIVFTASTIISDTLRTGDHQTHTIPREYYIFHFCVVPAAAKDRASEGVINLFDDVNTTDSVKLSSTTHTNISAATFLINEALTFTAQPITYVEGAKSVASVVAALFTVLALVF